MGRPRIYRTGICKGCKLEFEKRKPNGITNPYMTVCSKSCRGRVGGMAGLGRPTPIEVRERIAVAQKGSKGNNWKGGLWSSQPRNERKNPKYKKLRDSIFKRDNYTCVLCKARGELNVDHIKSYSKYPELRYIPSNLRTLCVPCHKKTESYGKG